MMDAVAEEYLEVIHVRVSFHTRLKLKRLAAFYGYSQRFVLECALEDMENLLLNQLNGKQQDAYYDLVQP